MVYCILCADSRHITFPCQVCGYFFCEAHSEILDAGHGRICQQCGSVSPGPSMKTYKEQMRTIFDEEREKANKLFASWRHQAKAQRMVQLDEAARKGGGM